MSIYIKNLIHNFNEDETMSKNKVPNGWEIRVHLKKGKPHAIKGMGPKLSFDIKHF
jgi:hypothetical protein